MHHGNTKMISTWMDVITKRPHLYDPKQVIWEELVVASVIDPTPLEVFFACPVYDPSQGITIPISNPSQQATIIVRPEPEMPPL